jgi:uncharacterized protein YndB with AHSA1/START domain
MFAQRPTTMSTLQARNEAVINAPVERIWSVITDIHLLPKLNPGVVKATGAMDRLNATRTCEIVNGSRKGTMTERLIEMEPKKRTVWTIESDTMGMSKMLSGTRFTFSLEDLSNARTRVVNETHYTPANLMARVMNALMMRRMIGKAQATILENLRALTNP